MKTREEIALAVLPAIYAESLNHEMDPHAIATDAFAIADAFIKVRDRKSSDSVSKPANVSWDLIDNRMKFAAMNSDGSWTAFSEEPNLLASVWSNSGGKFMVITKLVMHAASLDWRNSLVERPK